MFVDLCGSLLDPGPAIPPGRYVSLVSSSNFVRLSEMNDTDKFQEQRESFRSSHPPSSPHRRRVPNPQNENVAPSPPNLPAFSREDPLLSSAPVGLSNAKKRPEEASLTRAQIGQRRRRERERLAKLQHASDEPSPLPSSSTDTEPQPPLNRRQKRRIGRVQKSIKKRYPNAVLEPFPTSQPADTNSAPASGPSEPSIPPEDQAARADVRAATRGEDIQGSPRHKQPSTSSRRQPLEDITFQENENDPSAGNPPRSESTEKLSAYVLGQRRRRAKEAQEKNSKPKPPPEIARSLGQQRRRERERAEKEQREAQAGGLATPPATQSSTHNMGPRLDLEDVLRRIRSAPLDHSLRAKNQLQTPPATQRGASVNQRIEEDDQEGRHEDDNERDAHREEHENRERNAEMRVVYHNPFVNSVGTLCAARRPFHEHDIIRHDLGLMNVVCRHCNALHWMAERRVDSSMTSPHFGTCCDHGKVRLSAPLDPPNELQDLVIGHTREAKMFRENISQYNSALAFTSVGVNVDNSVNHVGRGQPVFRIHGELRHWSGSLLPLDNRAPSYAQLYILDPQAALRVRMQRNENLDAHTMRVLQDMLQRTHVYSDLYLRANEIIEENGGAENFSVRLRLLPGQDARRYNEPRVDEIAALIPGDENTPVDRRDIVLRLRTPNGEFPLQRIYETHPSYAPLHYVLLFPHGEPGWHPEMRLHNPDSDAPSRLTLTRYVAYYLHTRPGEFSLLIRSGRLFQRWLVDMWASADQSRLRYMREHQKDFRRTLYSGLEDAVTNGDHELNDIGQRVLLPSSYVGGPRYMHQRFQDAMALVRRYTKVDLFITVTANPNWDEITRELLPGQTAYDRPELVSRVFKAKKTEIINDIYKGGIFGQAVAYVYTIEFQKRGLPHMHLLVILRDGYKLHTPDDVDTCIRAYWPDPDTEPELFEIVKSFMIHGPCGAANWNCPCMADGKCTKNFPKPFQEYTTMDQNGYPKYKRPDDGRKYKVGNHWVDNSWVVPYSPYLSLKYKCHVNVECAATIAAVKYTVKYIHKGPDRGSLEVGERDEIKLYIEGRYFSASEASWRTFHFDIHHQEPSVQPLQVHLEREQMVSFDPNDDPAHILANASFSDTTLTAFFNANADDGEAGREARKYVYEQFPEHYVFQKANRKHNIPARWKPRQQNFSIGRMYYIPPNGSERFYLRLLLTVVRGPKSFQDLRIVTHITYDTYRDACIARGLLADDREWKQCLEEARLIKSGAQLRQLFVTILLFCSPTKPEKLWEEFRVHITDDLEYRLIRTGIAHPSQADVFDYGLFLIDTLLEETGHSLDDFSTMPKSHRDRWNRVAENSLIAEQLNYHRDNEHAAAEEHLGLMNIEQRAAYDAVMDSVMAQDGRLFFLDGHGGTGKTFVYATLAHAVRGEGWIVLCVASTGIAALILPGGRTGHSMFKIPIDGLTGQSTCSIDKLSPRGELIRHTRLIIYDEAPMQHKFAFEAVDRTIRDLRDSMDLPFGGITTVLGGDFKQLLPVVVHGSREDIVTASLQRSYLWPYFHLLRLHQNMRLGQDLAEQDFAKWLLTVGNGDNINMQDSTIPFPSTMRIKDYNSLLEYIYTDIRPDLGTAPAPEYFLDRAILAPRNVDVYAINSEVLERMPGEELVFYSADALLDDNDGAPLPPELLRQLDPSGLPPGELHVKIGCPLILLRNLAPVHGLCNGTRMVLVQVRTRVLEVKIIGGDHHGEHAFIPRIVLIPSDQAALSVNFKRQQFPCRLAFAMSVHKSQGQSLKMVGLDLRTPVFSHGQLYVALSRVTSSQRIRILLPENARSCRTVNVVYPEILLH